MSEPDRPEEIALLTEIRDLLRSIEARATRAETTIERLRPALVDLGRRAMLNPRIKKLLQ